MLVTLIIIIILLWLLLTVNFKRAFQEGSQSSNLTIQPLTVPDRLKEGCYYELIMVVIDAEEDGDQNALGLSFIRRVEVKICTINWFYFVVRVPPCTIHHCNYTRLVLPLVHRCFIGLYGAWQIDSNGVTFVTMCSVDHPTEVHFHMHTTNWAVQYWRDNIQHINRRVHE